MDAYRTSVAQDAQKRIEELPQRLAHVHALVQQHFQARTPSAVRATLKQSVTATRGKVDANATLDALIAVVGDEIEQVLTMLAQLSQWIQLLVPKIADGNNFGVEVQKLAYVHVKESIATWQKQWDALVDYYNQRATAVEKVNDKIAKESSKSTTVTATTGGKDGDENKSVTTSLDKETATSGTVVDDWVSYIVAVDVKWYFNLAHTLEAIRDQYAVTADIIEKNKDKIVLPRGNSDRAAFSMF
ncbi:Proteasome activator subunit 1, partial [Globisporangium splendens]